MRVQKLLVILIMLAVSCSQQQLKKNGAGERTGVHQLPISNAISKYKALLQYNDAGNFITIDSNSIELIPAKEMVIPVGFELFRFTIFNGAHYEYNNGQIICLALVSRFDKNDIRILFPRDYAKSAVDFFDPYFDKTIDNKKDYCTRLSNLINYNLTYQRKPYEYQYADNNNSWTVISKHKVAYYDFLNKKDAVNIKTDTVKFSFAGDTLKSFWKTRSN